MSDINKIHVTILYADIGIVKKILKNFHPDYDFDWIYLGKDVPFSLSLNKLFGKQGRRLEIADLLQVTAKQTRQQYIDYIGALGSAQKTKCWWLTSISEKNPCISLFLLLWYNHENS